MNRHATLDELARLGADDLRVRKAGKVSRHLATCPRCTQLNDQLSLVPALLSSVQFPEMPANLATRIDASLAAEAAHRVAAEPATESGRRDLPTRAARSRADRQRANRPAWGLPVPATRVLATAAAIIVVGIGAYAVASHSGGSSSAPSVSGAAAVPAITSQVSLGPSVTYRQDESSKSIQTVSGNTNFQAKTLAEQAAAALSVAEMEGMHSGSGSSGAVDGSGLAPTSSANNALGPSPTTTSAASQLGGCIDRVVLPGQSVLMVERAKFEGQPATIIVTAPAVASGTSTPKDAEIWAVGDACSATNSDVLDHVKVARL